MFIHLQHIPIVLGGMFVQTILNLVKIAGVETFARSRAVSNVFIAFMSLTPVPVTGRDQVIFLLISLERGYIWFFLNAAPFRALQNIQLHLRFTVLGIHWKARKSCVVKRFKAWSY